MKIRIIKSLIRKSYLRNLRMPSSTQMDDRILRDALAAVEESIKAKSTVIRSNSLRTLMKSRITRIVTAAVIVIAVVGLFVWLTTENAGAGVAFADVLRQTRKTKTVTYIMVPVDERDDSGTALHVKYMEPGRMRIDTRITTPGPGRAHETVMIMDFGKKKILILDPKRKKAILTEMGPVSAQMSAALIQDNIIEEIKSLRAGSEVALGTKQINGRRVAYRKYEN